MKRVVSFALFRGAAWAAERAARSATPRNADAPWVRDYEEAMPPAVAAARILLPSWEVRIHHDGCSPWIERAAAAGHVVAVDCGAAPELGKAALWRMMPLFDDNVEAFITRDLDAVMMPLEAGAVQQWIASGYPLHMIHDHQLHYKTLAGLLGLRCAVAREQLGAREWSTWVDAPYRWDVHGADQAFLNDKLAIASGLGVMLHLLRGNRRGMPHNTRYVLHEAPGERWPWFIGAPVAPAAALPFLLARDEKTTREILAL